MSSRKVSKARYGQLVIGPPGSGKSTYVKEMAELLTQLGRKVAIINLDPANDTVLYNEDIGISELITVEDAMKFNKLGPNGGLVYCMEYLDKNIDWILEKITGMGDRYFMIDCPGQVELYTHHNSVKHIMEALQDKGSLSLCTLHLVDSHYCSDPAKYLSALLTTLSTMLHMELPHINVLSKVDTLERHSDKLAYSLEYYTEVLDLSYLLDHLQGDGLMAKYKKLNEAIVSLVEDYSLVSFVPLDVKNKQLMLDLKKAVDKANGYVYSTGEEQSIQMMLAAAVGPQGGS